MSAFALAMSVGLPIIADCEGDFELMRSHSCPLGFADSDEYKAFMSELCCHMCTQLSGLCFETSARHFER
jgi:hypothetical protein